MKIKEMIKAIWFQIRKKDSFKDIFITHNAFGIFSRNSHENVHYNIGKEKQKYPTLESANKAAEHMSNKFGGVFQAYKCGFCDGYHIGRDQ